MKKEVFLLLGSDMGDRLSNLSQARDFICAAVGALLEQSPIYETEAWGFASEALFLNQVLRVESDLSAFDLLELLKQIELRMGRLPSLLEGYVSRAIDIDILFYGNELIDSEHLTIPHSKLHERRFALLPMVDIASDMYHPLLKKSLIQLLNECQDTLNVRLFVEK